MPSSDVQPATFSATQVAIYLGVSKSTVWALVREGSLEPHKIGTRTLFLRSDVAQLLKGDADRR
jgi:excisionase family DNA binding protein